MKSSILLWTSLMLLVPTYGQVTLEQYNIDPNSVTVSGVSSGGGFATQYHVIHSETVMGVAIFAGVIYLCANGVLVTALLCMTTPALTIVNTIITETEELAFLGSIDKVEGMTGDRVYIFAATDDTTVNPGNVQNIETFYDHFGSNIKIVDNITGVHCQPTDFYGPSCDYQGGQYINDCDYNGAYEALNYMYGNTLIRADESLLLAGQLLKFNQREFFPLNLPGTYSMDNTGYVYIPQDCENKVVECRLHVVFHGCLQGQEYLEDTFVINTGYLQVAEANNIIILFPQIIRELLLNPEGCWDWWGYTGILNYATTNAHQVKGVNAMVERLLYNL